MVNENIACLGFSYSSTVPNSDGELQVWIIGNFLFFIFRLDVMQACWYSDPDSRPSFGTIISMLEPYVSTVFRTSSFHLNQPLTARRQHECLGETTELLFKPRTRPKPEGMEADGGEESEELDGCERLLNAPEGEEGEEEEEEDEIRRWPSSR